MPVVNGARIVDEMGDPDIQSVRRKRWERRTRTLGSRRLEVPHVIGERGSRLDRRRRSSRRGGSRMRSGTGVRRRESIDRRATRRVVGWARVDIESREIERQCRCLLEPRNRARPNRWLNGVPSS